MRYPKLNVIAHDKRYIDIFGGYNHNTRIAENEFYDVVNMTADAYPLLKTRNPHGVYIDSETDGMISKDEFCYISQGTFFMKNSHVDLGLTSGEKVLVSMGAYVIILPDKKYVNTANLEDNGSLEAQCSGNSAIIHLCSKDGTQLENSHVEFSNTQPTSGKNGYYWVNTSTTPATLYRYSGESGEWFDVPSYIKISSEYITNEFEAGDSVTLRGFTSGTTSFDGFKSIVAAGIDAQSIGVQKNFIAVPGIITETSVAISTNFTLSRDVPDMDFVIEANNRLWGCKYGIVEGKLVNEIYASKLGDFKNWHNYAGISTDSYAASVGTDGKFTGAINYGGYPLFFKERCVHKVFGYQPSNFQIQTDTINGVQEGCHKSLAIINEVLYYKSRSGVCAYDGSLPAIISEKLGNEEYKNAVGGGYRNKYYLTMKQTGIAYDFIYDTKSGIWHRSQIPQQIVEYCAHGDELYFRTNPAVGGFIGTTFSQPANADDESGYAEKCVFWHAESGMIGLYTEDKKYLVSLNVRIKLENGTKVRFYVEYDSSGYWQPINSMIGRGIQIINMPIIPRRCDHFRIRIEGEGAATLFSICKTTEEGTEV